MTAPLTTRRVFVTGATGYLGARLIPLLLERGHHVTALTRMASVRKVPTGCQIVVGDPLESGAFIERARSVDTLVQLVGVPKPAPWKGSQFRAIDGPSAMAAGLVATILRPWYILGPGHWWPLALQPIYRLLEQVPATRDAAQRLGLVTIQEILVTMLWAIEQPASGRRVIEVPEIRRLGRSHG